MTTQTKTERFYVVDFDCTFIQVEALDELGKISLAGTEKESETVRAIKEITNQCREGEMGFQESLRTRIKLLQANQRHLDNLIGVLKNKISKSIQRNKDFFIKNADHIYIISNGFKAFIIPIVSGFGIEESHVFANTFEFDEQGNIIGFDQANPLSANHGKASLLTELNLSGEVHVIGDGHTDYEIKAAGLAHKFVAFTENVSRPTVLEKADEVAPSFDEYLYVQKLNTVLSYPKNRIKVLLLENIHPTAYEILKLEGYSLEVVKGGLDEDELMEKIERASILCIRSKTQLTERALEKAERLIAVGAFCIGTNQIDLEACLKRGIAVFNAPYSNTRSVVELAIGHIIMLMRRMPVTMAQMQSGVWNKSAHNSFEIRGKRLGIVGYGNIGSQLSVLAENLGMEIYYYDILDKLALGNARKCRSLDELLQVSDVISLHVDGRQENYHLIGPRQLDKMKDGVILVNLSRGHVIELGALKAALESGKVGGTAIDVFPEEPKNNQDVFKSDLIGLPNTILTPHVGGSTLEAQHNIAQFVPEKIINYINTGSSTGSVNFPNLQLPPLEKAHRLIHIHNNVPGILAKINNVLADNQINILGQYLKTNETIGYVITDIDKVHDKKVIKDLKRIPDTIRFRILY